LQFSVTEVQKLKSKLQDINDSMVDGKFVDAESKEYRGSHVVSDLLGRCLLWSDIVLERYAVPQAIPLQLR
jgi:hypothetical protein